MEEQKRSEKVNALMRRFLNASPETKARIYRYYLWESERSDYERIATLQAVGVPQRADGSFMWDNVSFQLFEDYLEKNYKPLYQFISQLDFLEQKRTLKAWREYRGFTQEDIAEYCEVSLSTYKRWEKRPNKIKATAYYIVCEALAISPDMVILDEGEA